MGRQLAEQDLCTVWRSRALHTLMASELPDEESLEKAKKAKGTGHGQQQRPKKQQSGPLRHRFGEAR